MKKIESIEHLKAEAKDGADFVIMLRDWLRSSKRITYLPEANEFDIFNEIDGTWQTVKTENLADETLIPDAIAKGRLFKD